MFTFQQARCQLGFCHLMSCVLFSYVGIKHILFRSLDFKFEPKLNLVHEVELDEYICFDGVFDRHQFCKLQQSLA